MPQKSSPVFRFAPSPNGWLHLGHALSAILNSDAARRSRGRFLLRIEDIDATRAREEFVDDAYRDLAWLGLAWETPVRRQSQHLDDYASALDALKSRGLAYPCFCARSDIARAVADKERESGAPWPRDPEGAPLYPGTCRSKRDAEIASRLAAGEIPAWRLDMMRALAVLGGPPHWTESADGAQTSIDADPAAWGDVVVARKDIGTSYHLAVVVDDALQGVTHVVRGRDLYFATAIHRVLQILLGLPEPVYTHHRLVLDEAGGKLSKSVKSTALRELRAQGRAPAEIRAMIGL
ncbi:MAG: tRNA glutamyl-Q(34) synthetase GluQRS [Beijerinckiaceae bacterium]